MALIEDFLGYLLELLEGEILHIAEHLLLLNLLMSCSRSTSRLTRSTSSIVGLFWEYAASVQDH